MSETLYCLSVSWIRYLAAETPSQQKNQAFNNRLIAVHVAGIAENSFLANLTIKHLSRAENIKYLQIMNNIYSTWRVKADFKL